jgi:hypothetical protein
MKNLLIQLNQRPIAVYPIYIKITGSVNAGLLLSQLMYWYGAMNGRIFYKTDAEIMEETCLSESELRTAKNKLKSMSFIEIKAKGVPAKTYYSINAEKLISEIHNISSVKSTKLKKRNQQNCNSEINETITESTTENTTKNTSYILSENSKEFSPIEINGIEIKENRNGKVNPFQLISELQKLEEKKSGAKRKEEAEPTERKPNPTYEAFTIFCETFERLSGANYPKDKNGNYLMSKKDAGGMVYLMRNVEQVDRNGNSIEALKVFVTAAWNLNDKWIRANFTPNTLYGQFSKIFTGYQTSSPEMIEKKKNDRIAELLAEKMKQYENQ